MRPGFGFFSSVEGSSLAGSSLDLDDAPSSEALLSSRVAPSSPAAVGASSGIEADGDFVASAASGRTGVVGDGPIAQAAMRSVRMTTLDNFPITVSDSSLGGSVVESIIGFEFRPRAHGWPYTQTGLG